jgi:hypothetical protein
MNGCGSALEKITLWQIGIKWYPMAAGLALVSRLAISVLAIILGWTTRLQLYDWTPLQYTIIRHAVVEIEVPQNRNSSVQLE